MENLDLLSSAFEMTHKPNAEAITDSSGSNKAKTTQNEATAAPRLSLKPKITTTTPPEKGAERRTRNPKRIIRRDELPANKLSTIKAPPKPKPKQQLKSQVQKKPDISPSDVRLDNLNANLNNYSEAWRDYLPLMVGIEKEVFRHIAEHHLSASKRVVQWLLRQHTQDERYQRSLLSGGGRYHLDGTKAGQ